MSTAAGWYDDGSGRNRWWDGEQWTERFADASASEGIGAKAADLASKFGRNIISKHDPSQQPGTLWSAVGQPLSHIGAGRYRLTEDYLFFEKGTLSTKGQQIRVAEIFDVDAKQTLAQKARGIGTIKLIARRPNGDELVQLEDIPNFREGVDMLNRLADEARQRLITREHTQHVNYTGISPAQAAISSPAVSPAAAMESDATAQILKLAELHQAGILSDDEFAAAKAKALGL